VQILTEDFSPEIRGVLAVTPDDLTAPLGQRKPARPSRKLTLAQLHLIAGVLALSLVVGTGWMFLADNPFGRATAANGQMPSTPPGTDETEIRVIRLSPAERMAVPDDKIAAAPVAVPLTKTITIIDGTSGRRQEVEIPVAADPTPNRAAEAPPEPSRPTPPLRAAERSGPSEAGARRTKNNSAKPTTP
jgi:hypothetical protein